MPSYPLTGPPPSSHPTSYSSRPPVHGVSPYRTPSPPYGPGYLQPIYPAPPGYVRPPPTGQSYHPPPPPPEPVFVPTFASSHRTNSASPSERYMCHECNKSFSRPSSLRIHTFSHTGEKPFLCPERGCTKRFSVRSNMRRHMKVHTEMGSADVASTRGDDEMSERSPSPGHHIAIRPRQGSRSSI